jgi:NAD(P)-dependent dehydrogenase (short-subunit alcohol dehydrogenase family)
VSAKTVIVTGAARGIGRSIAEDLGRSGFAVHLVDVDDEVRAVAARLAAAGQQASYSLGSIASESDCERFVNEASRLTGSLYGLVNNAAVGGPMSLIGDTSTVDFRLTIEVNLIGTFQMTRAVIPALRATGGGRLVHITSMFGQVGTAQLSPYSASKAAVSALSQCAAVELGGANITSNCVSPGYIMTPMLVDDADLRAGEQGVSREEVFAQMSAKVPIAAIGSARDVAGAVQWLLSEEASYVSGQTIAVNGGALVS